MDDDKFRAKLRTDLGSAVRQWERHGWSHRCIRFVEARSTVAAEGTLLQMNRLGRDLHLFDTFEEMQKSSETDVDSSGKWSREAFSRNPGSRCADSPLKRERGSIYVSGYLKESIHFVHGKVKEAIPEISLDTILPLQFKTNWCSSTKHGLVPLYPGLLRFGMIDIDDYGPWRKSRQACDE